MNSRPQINPKVVAELRMAMALVQRGDIAGARAVAERALTLGSDQAVVQGLLGMLCCQSGDLPAGIEHLRAAHRADPSDNAVTANLVTALNETGAMQEALQICTEELSGRDPSRRLWRLRGYLLQVQEDYAGAAEAYRHVVDAVADDFESWNNLGNALAGTGDVDGSIAALRRAAALRPDAAPIRLNLASALVDGGRLDEAEEALTACVRDFPEDSKPLAELAALMKQLNRDEEARDALERAVALEPEDAELQIKLGVERITGWAMEEGEEALRKAIAIKPSHSEAHALLGTLLEHMNRADQYPVLIASAEAAGVDKGAVQFIRALSHRREKRFEDGLAALADVPEDLDPVRRAQLSGQFHDGLGNTEAAFAAFSEMNRLVVLDPSEPLRRGEQYRAALRRDREMVTAQWYAGWDQPEVPASRPSPVFLVGFPRSGTTLLDTMLMGHPQVQLLEERPPISRVEQAVGGLDRLATLGKDDIAALREQYFRAANEYIDLRPDSLLVDKFPLHLNKVPLIHRLFPDARFILALRHPCDVVLSCFITNFRPNNAMVNFLDLGTSAEVYDLTFGFWEQCRAIMPIQVHTVSYERVVADSEAELRPLFDYLGLDWRQEVLDHRQTAARRGVITTASYAQVTEPLYKRAAGRWQGYKDQLAPVLPVLQPWIEHFGYSL